MSYFAEALVAMNPLGEAYYLKIGKEWVGEEEDRHLIFVASLYEAPPEDGWPTQGHYFHSVPGAIHWKLKQPFPWQYDDAIRCAVTAETVEDCARLAMNMLKSIVPREVAWKPECPVTESDRNRDDRQ